MRNLWQLFQGYGEVELKGMGLERALTQLERAGVTLWHRVFTASAICRGLVSPGAVGQILARGETDAP